MAAMNALPTPWLVMPRLRLREFAPCDREALVRMHREPRVRALLVDDAPLERYDVAALLIERLQTLYRSHEGLGIWHAERRLEPPSAQQLAEWAQQHDLSPALLQSLADARHEFIGWFNLMPMPQRAGEVELGARLLPAAWGSGLAMEGGEHLLRHAFESLLRPRVWAVCDPRHEAVRCVLFALGFEDQGVRDYEGARARHYVLEVARWERVMRHPRRERLRAALARMRRAQEALVDAA
jgi:RimJ/RimL family protein N-acetyltransferase